ncbi:hypothetical protein HYT26_02465 [Candidatus Pacearchaeota archaeon]|nr:hypothetical protein [Candidatus Pacearchaeota archaeon]
MENEIRALMVIEILGRPVEYILESMDSIVTKIGGEKGARIITKKVHEAKAVEKADNLFTTFAEIEFETENIETLFRIIFTYNPSHIDIINPEQLVLKNTSLNLIANEIIRKLHQYDEVAKILSIERNILANKLRQANIPVSEIPSAMHPEIQKQAVKAADKKSGSKIKKQKGKTSRKKKRGMHDDKR